MLAEEDWFMVTFDMLTAVYIIISCDFSFFYSCQKLIHWFTWRKVVLIWNGGIETKPLFLCNHEKTSDCSNGVGKINSPLLPGWPTAEMICVWKDKPCSN